MFRLLCITFLTTTLINLAQSAPIKETTLSSRKAKALSYFDYVQPTAEEEDYPYGSSYPQEQDYLSMELNDNDLSRGLPHQQGGSRRKTSPRRQQQTAPSFNSPIYYIRLPPTPYMFVPGLGYVSQPPPPPSHVSQFVNLPVNFISNGKPATIYQWDGGMNRYPTPPPTTTQPPKKKKPLDSKIHKLTGQYNFNGKPEDIFVLRDSYNSLYGDALQNFYP